MTREEQLRFIDEELKGLWPQWDPTDAEVRIWIADLASFDYGLARAAAQASFRRQAANYHRPVLARFLEQARALSAGATRGRRQLADPTTNVFVECLEPPPHRPCLAGMRIAVFTTSQDDPDHVRACAESLRTQCEPLYGGHWITVVTDPHADDGLRGEPARQNACRQILDGPETPGKRWLQGHLARQSQPPEPDADIPLSRYAPFTTPARMTVAPSPPATERIHLTPENLEWLDSLPTCPRQLPATDETPPTPNPTGP